MQTSRPSPPKPWEINRSGASTSTLPTTPMTTTAATTPTATTTTSSIPPRPSTTSNMSRPWDLRSSSTYGNTYNSSYGNTYGTGYNNSSYGYGNTYGGYGSYGSSMSPYSRYGGYGSTYGSSYGGYGSYGSSSYDRYSPYSSYGSSYGSTYGGYGNYGNYGMNRYGGPNGPMGYNSPGMFQSVMEGGYNRMRDFGNVVEGVSRFSRLLDANFDAMHGSVGSILRMIDVAGEFLFTIKTFSMFRGFFRSISKFGRFVRWLLFGVGASKLVLSAGQAATSGISTGDSLDFNDYLHYQSEQKRKRLLPLILMLVGFIFVGAPMLIAKLMRQMPQMVDEPDSKEVAPGTIMVQAINDFQGQNEQELSFRRDDTIIVMNKPFPDWWEGEINGRIGMFPANFVKVIEGPLPPVNNQMNNPMMMNNSMMMNNQMNNPMMSRMNMMNGPMGNQMMNSYGNNYGQYQQQLNQSQLQQNSLPQSSTAEPRVEELPSS